MCSLTQAQEHAVACQILGCILTPTRSADPAQIPSRVLNPSRWSQERDGYPADIECIFMTDGASPGVHRLIQLLTRSESDSFLTPVPQYPLYSASLALYGTSLTPYYLDESINWGLNLEHLQEQYDNVGAPRSSPLHATMQPAQPLLSVTLVPASIKTAVQPPTRIATHDMKFRGVHHDRTATCQCRFLSR